MKKFFVLVLTLLMVVGLVACVTVSNSTNDSSQDMTESTDNITGTVTPGDTSVPDNNETTVPNDTDKPVVDDDDTTDNVCSHSNTELLNAKESTCTEQGYSGDTYCNDCKATVSVGTAIDATGHINTQIVNAKSATCTEKGYTGDTKCTDCENIVAYGEEIDATGHLDLKTVLDVKPTCDTDGYTGDTVCTICNDTITTGSIIPATGHNTTVINVKNATCEADGYTGDTYCTDCNNTVKTGSVIPATGHTQTKVINAKSATCTKGGYTGDKKCLACNKIVGAGETIPAKGHGKTKMESVVAPTCANEGYTGDKVCTVCNDTLEKGKTIPMVDHKIEIVGRVEPTTTSDGYSGDIVCSVCNTLVERGVTLGKLENDTPKLYQSIIREGNYEYKFMIPYDNPFDYTLGVANKQYNSEFAEIEEKILVYVNEERSKLGLAPVAYEHRADYFTHLRAVECFEFFEHERPDGRQWHTAYYDEGVYIERAGENLVYTTSLYEIYGSDFDIARYFVDSWMESPGHRSAILNPNFTSMSASVIIQDGEYIAVQHFFGPNSL